MNKTYLLLFCITFVFVYVVISIVFLVLFNKKRSKKYKLLIQNLELNKNLIVSSTLLTELKKLEGLCSNKYVKEKYDSWILIYTDIENKDLKSIDDKLFNLDSLIEDKKINEIDNLALGIEKEILYVKTKADVLLENITSITNSEEKNRNALTLLKKKYRAVVSKYKENYNEYKLVEKSLDLQLETIDKLFSAFEVSVENNEFEEIGKIVKALDDLINNLEAIVEEAPTILLICNVVLPNKINEIEVIYDKMVKNGYNLEYLNLDYNIDETKKKINVILDKVKVLNIEDSVFELKTLLNYYESIFSDFNKEKECKKVYDNLLSSISEKIDRSFKVIKNIYVELSTLKNTYDLNEDEIGGVDILGNELVSIKDEYKLLCDRTNIKVMPYSKIVNDLKLLSVKIGTCEDSIELTIKNLSSLKEDEVRAREQLLEVKKIVKESEFKMSSYKFPVIPKNYKVLESEAKEGIEELIKELEKRPINIKNLNIRVDTSRDLALKFLGEVNEYVKSASISEASIVYGNRYRSTYKDVELGLIQAEEYFFNGEYRKSLETSLNAINIVEPYIHKKILKSYES